MKAGTVKQLEANMSSVGNLIGHQTALLVKGCRQGNQFLFQKSSCTPSQQDMGSGFSINPRNSWTQMQTWAPEVLFFHTQLYAPGFHCEEGNSQMEMVLKKKIKQGHIYQMSWTALHRYGVERPEGTRHEVGPWYWQAICFKNTMNTSCILWTVQMFESKYKINEYLQRAYGHNPVCFKTALSYLNYLIQYKCWTNIIMSCLANSNKLNKFIHAHVRCSFPNSFYIKLVAFKYKLFGIKKKKPTVLI